MIGNGARSCQFNTINGPEAPPCRSRADGDQFSISIHNWSRDHRNHLTAAVAVSAFTSITAIIAFNWSRRVMIRNVAA